MFNVVTSVQSKVSNADSTRAVLDDCDVVVNVRCTPSPISPKLILCLSFLPSTLLGVPPLSIYERVHGSPLMCSITAYTCLSGESHTILVGCEA